MQGCLGVSIFCKVSKSRFLCWFFLNDVFSSLDISLKQLSISEKKSNLTSPKFSEFNKKLEKLTATSFWRQKKTVILF